MTPHTPLREISVGDGEGMDAAIAFSAVPGFLRDPDVAMPGGEAPRQVRERAGRELDRILIEQADAPVVAVVGHGNMNRMLLSHLLGIELERALRIRQDWAGVNVLERRDGAWTIGGAELESQRHARVRTHTQGGRGRSRGLAAVGGR